MSYPVHSYNALQTQVLFIHMEMSGVERVSEGEGGCAAEAEDESSYCACVNDCIH